MNPGNSHPSAQLRRRYRGLKFRAYRLIKRPVYRGYRDNVRMLSESDPDVLSRSFLSQLLAHAGEHVPYYRDILPSGSEFTSLPILTKDVIRNGSSELKAATSPGKQYLNSSGGATGEPVTFIQDTDYQSWNNATQAYYFSKFHGLEPGYDKSVWLWGSERDTFGTSSWRTRLALSLQSRLLLNTFAADETRWIEYADRIRTYRPSFVAGYAGSLYQLARVARNQNLRLYSPRFVHSSAERLHDFMRMEIEEHFDSSVYDYYGSREVGAIAGECCDGSRHIFIQNNIVEILDDSDDVIKNGEEGRIVVTNLHNYSMPMIRYEIGDTGSIAGEDCTCGSSLPVLETLTGRVTDHFVSQLGTLIHGEFFTHLFYFRDWVEQFQVDQLSLDRVRVSIVHRSRVDEGDVADITRSMRLVMGSECDVEWRYVDEIEEND